MAIDKPILGITQGDINGVGLEVIIKTFLDGRMTELCTPIIFGSVKTASHHRKALEIQDFSFNQIKEVASANPKRANIINCYEEEINIELGKETKEGGKYALLSLQAACKAMKEGSLDALVTAPINKHNIQSENFSFAGHTGYLDQQFAPGQSLMLMVANKLKVAVVTGHIPVEQIKSTLNSELIAKKIEILHQSLLQDFGIRMPKIAVLGLNPHAGDQGTIGNEESEMIIPAINKVKEKNILAYGPYPADGFFGSGNYEKFDAVLAMYHDQGLVPFKSLTFSEGVNFTAGLPIIRTSPDHGTGYGIAGQNKASESSFREAIYLACDIFRKRQAYQALKSNALKPTEKQ